MMVNMNRLSSEKTPSRPDAGGETRAPRYSVVIPVFNEVDSLYALHGEVTPVMEGLGEDYEVLYVDDGSTDGTAEALDQILEEDGRVRIIRFSRNRGKSATYMEAFRIARGRMVITLDSDLQDDPAEIPGMIGMLKEGCDLVVGWKQGRLENEPLKKTNSGVFNAILRLMFRTGIHDSNSGFRAMSSEVADSLDLYGDLYRFIPQLAHLEGFRVTEHPVRHRNRKHGRSKYGRKRLWTGLLDLLTIRFITTYAVQRPLHFFGTVGLVPFMAGLVLEVYVLIARLRGGSFQVHVAAIIIGVLLMLIGFQCIITGLIGEMISAQVRSGKGRRPAVEIRDAGSPKPGE